MLNEAPLWLFPGSVFIIGLAIMLLGTAKSWQWRNYPGQFVIWGGVFDLGLAVAGLGLGTGAGFAGFILIILYHGAARLLAMFAWLALSEGLIADRRSLTTALGRHPVLAVIFCFALVASLGTSIFLTPDGQHLAIYAFGNVGGIVSIVLLALSNTILIWVTGDLILETCFKGEPGEIRFSWPSLKQYKHIYVLAGAVILFGLLRAGIQHTAIYLSGMPVPIMEAPWEWATLLLCWSGFLLVIPVIPKNMVKIYVLLVNVAAIVLLMGSDIDPLSRFFGVIIAGMCLVVSLYSLDYIHECGRKNWYWFLVLATFGSLLGLVTAQNLAVFATFWEIMTWASFALVAYEETKEGRAAAMKYLIMCGGAAYAMIPGLYMLGGEATLYDQVMILTEIQPTPVLIWASILCMIGFAAKAGLFPLYAWLPDAHPVAPSSISAPLSGILTKLGIFGLIMILLLLIGQGRLYAHGTILDFAPLGLVVTVLGLITMGIGEIMALRQEDIKRMLAYSTIGQVGEIVTVLGICTWLSTVAALSHVLNHAIMKDLLFLGAGALIVRTGSRKLSDLSGYVTHMPWTIGAMSVGLISIMGLPPFNGFVSKYLMIAACMQAGHWFIAVAILAASLVGAVYYLRILRTILLDKPKEPRAQVVEVSWTMRLALLILASLCILFGLAPQIGLDFVLPVVGMLVDHGKLMPDYLPTIQVVWPSFVLVPMIGAILPFILRKNQKAAAISAVIILLLSTFLVISTGHDLDKLSYYMAILIPAMGALNLFYSAIYMEHSHTQWRFYCFFLLMLGGLLGVAASTDLFSFFTFWEIMSSWALYFAIGHEGTKEALREAFKYFIFNLAGAAFIFMAIGLLVGLGGTSQFNQLGAVLSFLPVPISTAIIALFALGFCMKAAQVSLFIDWQMHPALAPTPVSGYISSVLLKIAVFCLVKLFIVFGYGDLNLFNQAQIMYFVAWAGAFTLLYSAYKAMLQTQLKLVFIWSTVSQIGYMVLGVAIGTSLGLAGGLLHMVNHLFFKDLLFLMVGAVMFKTHLETVDQLGGLGRKMPQTMGCFLIGALTAIGVPPTSGFTSKWIIYQALMDQGEILLALVSLIGTIVTIAYLARFMHIVFLGQSTPNTKLWQQDNAGVQEAPLLMRIPMFILVGVIIITSIFPGLLLQPINMALVEYGMPSLDVALYGLRSGPGAWNASLMTLLMVIAFGLSYAGLRFILRKVPMRVGEVHACGHDSKLESSRIPPSSVYRPLLNFLQLPNFRAKSQGEKS